MTQSPLEKAIYLPSQESKIGVLLLHAYTGTPKDVHLIGRKINRAGFGVLCPLFEGHWTSDIEDILAADPQTWLLNAQEALEWLKGEDYEEIIVFGLSMGGIMATALLSNPANQLLAGGVFNSPVVTTEPIDVSESFMAYAKFLYKEANKLEQFATDEADILAKHLAQVEKLDALKNSLAVKLPEIDRPFYIAQSGQDQLIEADDVFELQEALVNARIDFNWFADNTHVITVDRQRSEFEQSVLHFIEENTYMKK